MALGILSATVATLPPLTLTPISALIGTFLLPFAGLSLIGAVVAPPAAPDSIGALAAGAEGALVSHGAAALLSPPLHAVNVSGAIAANATTATSERRTPLILFPVLTFRAHILPYKRKT
jgi:hypothetical protein